MIGKEIQAGCNEYVNSFIADGILSNPANIHISSPITNVANNKNPPGYKWVDEEGWMDIEFDKVHGGVRDEQNDFN